MAVVETRKITKVFDGDVVVVRDIDLRTADGEFLVLLGPVRMRQDHIAQDDRRAGTPDLG